MDRSCRKAVSLVVAAAIVVAMALQGRSLEPLPAKGGALGGVAVSAPGAPDSAAILGQKPSHSSPAQERWKPQPAPLWVTEPHRLELPRALGFERKPRAEEFASPVLRSRLCRWLI